MQKNIITLLGIDTLAPSEQTLFVDKVGQVLLEQTLIRLLTVLSEEEVLALTQYVDSKPELETLLTHIFTHYEAAQSIFEEVVSTFTENAKLTLPA